MGPIRQSRVGIKTVYMLDDNEVYGKGLASLFKETAEENGLKMVGKQESIDYKQSDFRTLMARIKNDYKPDAHLLWRHVPDRGRADREGHGRRGPRRDRP